MRGRSIKLSPSRRLVCDLMRFSKSVPRVAVQRRMNLAPLAQARSSAVRRVSWTALMAKGYALLALDVPELRRAYIKLPWPQLYEYQSSVASIAHERDLEGERSVLVNLVKQPERRSVVGLDSLIAQVRSRPVLEVKDFRQALRFARLPGPVRWLLMWLGLNIGRQRANRFGTFQLSVYSGLGAEFAQPADAADDPAQLRADRRARLRQRAHPLRSPRHGWRYGGEGACQIRADSQRPGGRGTGLRAGRAPAIGIGRCRPERPAVAQLPPNRRALMHFSTLQLSVSATAICSTAVLSPRWQNEPSSTNRS